MIPVLELNTKVSVNGVRYRYGWIKKLWIRSGKRYKTPTVQSFVPYIYVVIHFNFFFLNSWIHNAYSAQDQYGVNKAVANIAAGFIPQEVTSQRAFS